MNSKQKTIVVTGGTSGVGKAIATGLATSGANVAIISRNAANGVAVAQELAQLSKNNNVDFFVADLSLQASVKKVSEEIKSRYDTLDGLVNAAGALFFEKQLTNEGFDKSFAINYLSHFSLTNQLLGLLKSTGNARVLTVGGAPMYLKNPKVAVNDLQLGKNYSGMKAVSQAMFERVYFGFELAKRLDGTTVTSNVFHPGLITSNLVKDAPFWLKAVTYLMKPWEKQDCEIGVSLTLSEDVTGVNGKFFDDKKRIIPINEKYDNSTGQKIWNESEELTNQWFKR